jgi:hypothetical protein
MNSKVIILLIFMVIVLAWLSLSFSGSMTRSRGFIKKTESVKLDDSLPLLVDNHTDIQVSYHNKDKRKNYYAVSFPTDWQVHSSNHGQYDISHDGITGYLKLLEIPNDTTLQLYILGQIEPKLKKELKGYKRIDYRDILVNGAEGFQLEYEYKIGKVKYGSFTDFISGEDNACIISFTSNRKIFQEQIKNFKSIIYTFKWE